MSGRGFFPELVGRLGPVEVTGTVLYSLIVSAILIVFALLVRVGLKNSSGWSVVAEFIVEHLEGIMHDMSDSDPRPYTPLVVTLALFIGTANLIGLVPGMRAPTADFSTTAALAVIVFLAVPLEIVTEFSRTLALAVRLFGNIVSEELIIAVLLTIAGLLVPVPIMMLAVLTGVVQAYIFAVLTMVYLSAAVRAHAK
jgi:F-type H+-transporting ATPase subunit a